MAGPAGRAVDSGTLSLCACFAMSSRQSKDFLSSRCHYKRILSIRILIILVRRLPHTPYRLHRATKSSAKAPLPRPKPVDRKPDGWSASYLSAMRFQSSAGMQAVHVPFKAGPETAVALTVGNSAADPHRDAKSPRRRSITPNAAEGIGAAMVGSWALGWHLPQARDEVL